MVENEVPPPRKKSRFFPHGRSQPAALEVEKHGKHQSIRDDCEERSDDKIDRGVEHGHCPQWTTGGDSIKPSTRDAEMSLPQRRTAVTHTLSTSTQDTTISSRWCVTEGHETANLDKHQQNHTKGSRRQGFYGVQHLELPATEGVHSSLNTNPSTAVIEPRLHCDLGKSNLYPPWILQSASHDSRTAIQPHMVSSVGIGGRTPQGQLSLPTAITGMPSQHHACDTSHSNSLVDFSRVKEPLSNQSQPVSESSEDISATYVSSLSFVRPTLGHQGAIAGCAPVRAQSGVWHPMMQTKLHEQAGIDESSSVRANGTLKVFSVEETGRLPCNREAIHRVTKQDSNTQLAGQNLHKNLGSAIEMLHHPKIRTSNIPSLPHPGLRSAMAHQSASQNSAGPRMNFTRSKDEKPVSGFPINHSDIDLDRDAIGILLPSHLRRFPAQPNVRPPAYKDPITPANLYTSPKRIEHAIAASSLKRKRVIMDPPPPAHIYQRTGDPDFNIFANGILLYPELCLALASQMQLRDLISLYAISKDFHTIIDSRFTTTCLTQALRKAPQSAQTFKFRSYGQYCRQDPAARIAHPNPAKAALSIPRSIPSFRWVAFVLHREKVVHELMTIFAERGCPLPARCSLALKRMWMLMDVPDNARRIAMVHNHRLITDLDLYFMTCFFVKLDMLTNDPVAEYKHDGLRKLLLSQRGGLDVLLKVLKRDSWRKQSDLMTAWIKTSMNLEGISDEEMDELDITTILGVPRDEVGQGRYEYWGLKGINDKRTGRKRSHLLRPDQLVMREAIRRGLRFSKHFLKCLLYGYVRPDTLEDYEPRKYGRRIGEWKDDDYDINDSVGNVRALAVEDGGDLLLDLGNNTRGSAYTIRKEVVSDQERSMRENQAEVLKMLYEISEREQL